MRWSATQEITGPSIAIDPAAVSAARTGFFALKLRCVRWRWKPTVTPIAQTTYMIRKTATSLQWSHEFQSCQQTIPSAMNGRAVIVPVAMRSAVSFLVGWMSSAVGPAGAAAAICVVTVHDPTQRIGPTFTRCYCPRRG